MASRIPPPDRGIEAMGEGTALPVFSASVRELAEYGWRQGDLDSRRFSAVRAIEGIRAHQAIQQSRPEDYHVEDRVQCEHPTNVLTLKIHGRVDGWYLDDAGHLVVEEIKTTRRSSDKIGPAWPEHRAQAMLYAALLLTDDMPDAIEVRVVYFSLPEQREVHRGEIISRADLNTFFLETITTYTTWLETLLQWQITRNASLEDLAFPYPEIRPGQDEMIAAIEEAVTEKQRLLIEAPTGIGKTVSALYPGVRAMAKEGIDKIFYLTAKTPGKIVAEKALTDLCKGGLRIKAITLTAKDKISCHGDTSCIGIGCPRREGYYDRLAAGMATLFENHDVWTREVIEQVAETHRLCSFEFQLDAALWADVIIADYNYVFDPRVYLRRFFADRRMPYLFLVDEAHNLPSRARDMFSASLDAHTINAARKAVSGEAPAIAAALHPLTREIKKHAGSEDGGSWSAKEKPEELLRMVHRAGAIIEAWLPHAAEHPAVDQIRQLSFSLSAFAQTGMRYNENYLSYAEARGKTARIKLLCLDPSSYLGAVFKRGRAAVLFSGTLRPDDYFRDSLALRPDDPMIHLASPFPPERLQIRVAPHLSTRYKDRPTTTPEIAKLIGQFFEEAPGNTLIFFPSYAYLRTVAKPLSDRLPFNPLQLQEPGMSEEARHQWLDTFATTGDATIGLAVLGGIFGEGIDLVGERLTNVVVVGTGLPQVNTEQELLRANYERQEKPGFDYAYTYPGLLRILQAGGRLIRSEADEGRLLLIDPRYGDERYHELLPPHWQHLRPLHDELVDDDFGA